jgi:fermentation-respiration switch protein FrsA (DUF1100 family)
VAWKLATLIVIGAVLLRMNLLERFIYYPERHLEGSPSGFGMRFEDVRFVAADGVALHGWFVPGRRAETLVWFHGNAGNISHRLDNLRWLHELVGVNVLLFDYRGYGQSAGEPSEAGLYADARAALAHLRGRSDVDEKRIIYFGRSLGSAVAVDLALAEPPYGLILETPFTSVRDMSTRLLPGPLSIAVPSMFDNLAKIESIGCPKLFIHGDADELVPYEQGRRLYESAKPPKAFFTIRGAGHNDTYIVGGQRYFGQIEKFIDGLKNEGA